MTTLPVRLELNCRSAPACVGFVEEVNGKESVPVDESFTGVMVMALGVDVEADL